MSPHSLSFRPVILPSSTRITLRKPNDNRSTAWVSLDGATRFELQDGEELILEAADDKVHMIVDTNNPMELWSKRLVKLMHWNNRQTQKAFTKKMKDSAN